MSCFVLLALGRPFRLCVNKESINKDSINQQCLFRSGGKNAFLLPFDGGHFTQPRGEGRTAHRQRAFHDPEVGTGFDLGGG